MTIPLTLAGLGGLQVLLLDGNRVADVGALSPLAGLERLRWLWLDPATAAGMEAWAPPAGRGPARLWIERVPAQ